MKVGHGRNRSILVLFWLISILKLSESKIDILVDWAIGALKELLKKILVCYAYSNYITIATYAHVALNFLMYFSLTYTSLSYVSFL